MTQDFGNKRDEDASKCEDDDYDEEDDDNGLGEEPEGLINETYLQERQRERESACAHTLISQRCQHEATSAIQVYASHRSGNGDSEEEVRANHAVGESDNGYACQVSGFDLMVYIRDGLLTTAFNHNSIPDLYNMCVQCWERWEPARRKTGVSLALRWSDPTHPSFPYCNSPQSSGDSHCVPMLCGSGGLEERTWLTHKSSSWDWDIKDREM
ncbi:hypothetical protein Q8A73_016326 [Channa argus]|nr:hypothetical protein Q8A73_016326 [Channa argus]